MGNYRYGYCRKIDNNGQRSYDLNGGLIQDPKLITLDLNKFNQE